MSEGQKRPRKPLDPNSGRAKINQITTDHYAGVWAAKEAGEKIGWCASNFPQEIFETLGIKVCYPENHAAMVAARGGGERVCTVAEGEGYSPDVCAYSRISMGIANGAETPEQPIPLPDFLLCCNNICGVMMKWYENLAHQLDIPMVFIDIPFSTEYDPTDEQVAYVRAQFVDAIHQLEEITGRTWDEDRFQEVMKISNRVSRAWLKIADYTKYKPSPYNGFDLLNYMAAAVFARGTLQAADAFETLCSELDTAVREGTTTFRGEEQHRILFEGIACWPYLRVTNQGLRDEGINTVATIYANAFAFIYDDFDGMVRRYCEVPNAVNLERSRDQRIGLVRNQHADGMLVHTNRSCKMWSGFMAEESRQIGAACDIPVASFDGDQADPRNFSEAQYLTRVQGLAEVMSEREGQHVQH
ncbi:MAG: 2-hydroxyacyl-CoA dehydratase family protein [Actinomyces sp.]|nr:2-hydroxyacyl-CoA dehydratase family protein [Actinomyces sp.]